MFKRYLKSTIALVLCLLMVSGTCMTAMAEATPERIVFHVSTTGKDTNPGTEALPFATIERAGRAVESTEHQGIPVDVLIHGGKYKLDHITNFSGRNAGGSEGAPVTYKAAGDGEVIFSGFKDIDITAFGPVTDPAMRERFRPEALPYIGAVDLAAQGFERNNLDMLYNQSRANTVPDTLEYLVLRLNGKEQWICQWPDYGEYAKINQVVGTSPTVVKYNEPTIDRWTDVSHSIVRGYSSEVYLERWNAITGVDKVNKTITFKYGAIKEGRTWRVLNIAEELDVPGEFYVDLDTMTLYFYPPYRISTNDKLELSVSKDVYLNFSETQFVNIEGVTFEGFRLDVRPYGLITIKKSNNMQVRGCTFRYNGGGACILFNGEENTFEANSFYNCGSLGIVLRNAGYSFAGNYPNFEHDNNKILNNHFYNTGTENVQGSGFAISTEMTSNYKSSASVGNIIRNNLIHHIYGGVNILYGNGNEYDISYNEIANGLRTLADYGFIYAGARSDCYGTEVNYNYLHGFVSALDSSYACNGIYFDDWLSGQTANNNIVIADGEGSTNAVFSVGAYNTMKNNISVTGRTGILGSFRTNKYKSGSTVLDRMTEDIKELPSPFDKYREKMRVVYDKIVETGMWLPVGDVITGNVTVNAKNNIKPETVELGTVENNYEGTDLSIFVDPDNHDWRIKSEVAEELGLDKDIMTDKNFDMDKIGIQKDVWDIKNPLDPFRQIYPANGAQSVSHKDVKIAWENALYADEYDYVVATDPELKNVVASGTTVFEFANLGDLDLGRSYYWKVTARNITRQLGAEWESSGVPYLFTTATKEVVEKGFLEQSITNAEKVFATVKDGTGLPGEFREGTQAKFQALLENAKHIYNSNIASQSSVDEIRNALDSAANGINASKNMTYITPDASDLKKWESASASTTVSSENGELTLTGGSTVAYVGGVENYNLLRFGMNANLENGWAGFTLRQKDPKGNVYSGVQYLVIIKKDIFEFQKYNPTASATGVLETKPNDGIVESDKWYDIEFAATDVDGGVHIFFKVNDQTIFDYYDTENPVYSDGYFCVRPPSGVLRLKSAENLPTEFYLPPEDIASRDLSTIYTQASSEFSSNTKWKEVYDLTMGYNQKGIYTSSEKDAAASYLIKGKLEDLMMFSYWHEAVENGDKNATMKITFNYEHTEEIVLTRKIDFSKGQSGWTPIGVFPFSAWGTDGTVKIEIYGSGEGTVVLPIIRKSEVSEERRDFAHLFYRSADNLVALKIGSPFAFMNGGEVDIPDTSARIISDRTYLPLRFMADAFGYDVSWDSEAYAATISDGDKTIVVTPGNNTIRINGTDTPLEAAALIENGRILLPLRDITEALGKTVLWNNDTQIVLVADSLNIKEADKSTFELIDKQFGGGK